MPFDHAGSALSDPPERLPERPPPTTTARRVGLAEAALAASACLLAWGLFLAVVGIGLGVLTVAGLL